VHERLIVVENRLNVINGSDVSNKVELTTEQSLAVHLIQERELRLNTVLEMNDLLKELDKTQAECAELKRAVFQERINTINKSNEEIRKQYELPNGKAQYSIENGKMFLIKAQSANLDALVDGTD